MRGNDFLDKMELVDSSFIEAASNDIIEKRKKYDWIKWGAMAACLMLIAFVGMRTIVPNISNKTSDKISDKASEEPSAELFEEPSENMSGASSELPKLTISRYVADGMGFEGHMAYDISELVNANPWNEEMGLTHMPVYENTLDYADSGMSIVLGRDYKSMRELLLRTAKNMGISTLFHTVKEYVPVGASEPESLYIDTDHIRITVDDTLTVAVEFKPAVALPDEYQFTFYSTWKEISEVANYLKKEYKDIIGFENPQMNIDSGEYDIYRRQKYSLQFYKEGDSDVKQIINYNFNRAVFYAGESNELSMIRIFEPDLTKKVGDYPIITSDEALDLLLEEKYITTVPYEVQGKEYVSKVELIYRTGQYEEYFMPYYRFYVEVPEETKEDGLKTYGAYYVPAVKGEYLSDVETWNGNFQ